MGVSAVVYKKNYNEWENIGTNEYGEDDYNVKTPMDDRVRIMGTFKGTGVETQFRKQNKKGFTTREQLEEVKTWLTENGEDIYNINNIISQWEDGDVMYFA